MNLVNQVISLPKKVRRTTISRSNIVGRRIRMASSVLFGKHKVQSPIIKAVGTGGARLFDTDRDNSGFRRIIPRPASAIGYQGYEELSKELMDRLPAEETRRLYVINNPAVARVVNDIKKFAISGWTLHPEGHPLFARLFDNMKEKNLSFNSLLGEFTYSLAVDGAMFSELVINENGDPRRISAIPAHTALFRPSEDEDGEYPELGQYNADEEDFFKSLSGDPTVQHEVLFPETGNPYGRTLIDPGLYHLNMVRGFFQSFKQAIASIIWPNLLINIDREVLKEMPPDEQNQLVADLSVQVKKEIEKLGPGGVLLYGSEVKVGDFISGMNSTNLGAVMDCVDIMDREIIRALETEPVLFGRNEGLAESHVVNQMINYGYFIRDIQKIINDTLTGYFNFVLRANNQAEVAQFRLGFSLVEEYIRRAEVYKIEKEALKSGSEDLQALVEATKAAEDAEYFDQEEARTYFKEQMEMRKREDLFNLPS